jgi:cbb3-type cytochrome oxidase subunit 3
MKEIFASSSVGLIGLLFFFVFFCGVTIWTFRPSAKKKYAEDSQIPLQEKSGEIK